MENTQFAMEMLDRAQERFEDTFDQMTTEEANQMPAPLIKSVVWLMWHTARELDMQISDLNDTEHLWTSAGWSEKFALDLPDDTEDYRHTPEEAAKVIVTDRQLVLDYLSDSIAFTKQYLNKIDESSLADVIDTNWNPPVTRQVRIISAIDDAVMHSGQAVYTRRMVIGK
ncbi:DinB family protein [Enterococcus hulanensis]|uniref:DinB family protein n=1 Tax=Enterococcus hulanensis TaxID=2559929 RepID=A0ABU3F191_9ENTE|nr:DinB family protein [Enterococcus hulanensis]MDT2600908.1 DinB family protein [Enterococcus hulanensis]MDT2611496.1 DinB family protein [Enterococcus hulanensis]MDT2618019.1 DinB family protein [Enterococcus hulanensis]MDT2629022.1 DinB family protein [Enterococcus hulanensis]MDT2656584.1 DinB family protein [Enterococcus hulanensis]